MHEDAFNRDKIEYRGYNLEYRNPYGFVFIVGKKGNIPEKLKSKYTTIQEAQKAIDAHVNALPKVTAKVD